MNFRYLLVLSIVSQVNSLDCLVPVIENGYANVTLPTRAIVILRSSQRVSYTSVLKVQCNAGYEPKRGINISDRAFCEESGTWYPTITTCMPTSDYHQCGISNYNRVHGGSFAKLGEFPWMANLEIMKPDGLQRCGGSLIDPNWILTSAHCVRDPTALFVNITLGKVNLALPTEPLAQYRVDERIVVHEDHYINDYALIKMNRPVELSPHVRTICLPDTETMCDPGSATSRNSAEFDSCRNGQNHILAAGWGTTEHNRLSDILKKLNLTLYSRNECRSLTLAPPGPTAICAGVPHRAGQDTCGGDSGGPLMCLKNNTMYVLGLVWYGATKNCGQYNTPGFYARTCSAIEWIKNVMSESHIPTSTEPTPDVPDWLIEATQVELFQAARFARVEEVRNLIQMNSHFIKVNSRNMTEITVSRWTIQGATALIALVHNCAALTGQNIEGNNVLETMRVLIDAGADVNSAELYDGSTALHLAARNCLLPQSVDIITLLIDNGANVDATNDNGWNAATHASQKNHTSTVQLLNERKLSGSSGSFNRARSAALAAALGTGQNKAVRWTSTMQTRKADTILTSSGIQLGVVGAVFAVAAGNLLLLH